MLSWDKLLIEWMELKEVLAYYNIYEIPNIPLPFPQGVVIVGIIIKRNLPKDQYLSDILTTIFINFSLISGLVYFQTRLNSWTLECSWILEPSFDS